MKAKSAVLTGEERDILILVAQQPGGKHLSNSEIAQRLGISVNRVKSKIHQACVKLGAPNRNQAIFFAAIRGEITLTEFYSLDEIAEIVSSLGPDMLRKIADLVRKKLEHGHLSGRYEQIICMDRRQDTILTERERDVLILAGLGLTNKEIADRLYISIDAVMAFLNRACTKLGAHNRADAVVLALKQREIVFGDIVSLKEMVQLLAPLGAETIEKIAQLLSQKLGQEPIPTGS